jgi:hypothetical protein
MEMGLKEKLLLLSINQENGNLRYQYNFYLLIFYASLVDLAKRNLVRIVDGNWQVTEKQTGDPVLDQVLKILLPSNDKKAVWFSLNKSTKAQKLLVHQVEWMVANRMIEAVKTSFLGIPTGYRFRIYKPEMLRPDLLNLERVLIYGRKPQPDTWMLIQCLGAPGILKCHFRSSESKRRAHARYKELRKMPPGGKTETSAVIINKLRNDVGNYSGFNID